MNSFLERVKAILPADAILTSVEERRAYGMDWTKVPGESSAVLLPRTVGEVSSILKLCTETKTEIIPSGGRTGLAGGIVARQGEVALNLQRMHQISPVDKTGLSVRVQAGAITQNVHEHCEREGLTWPIDLAAKGTSTIGGNLATNAGGVRVIRYGMARKWVTSLQAVTMNGEILEINRGLEKNNTGYDLVSLLVGSEGTLAVITEATLKLVRVPNHIRTFLFSVEDIEKADALFLRARKGPFEIQALEFFSEACSAAVEKVLHRKSKLSVKGKFSILLDAETEGHPQAKEALEEWLSKLVEEKIVLDGLLAQTSEERKYVWSLREGITESLQQLAPVKKFDVAVPVNQMVSFMNEVEQLFREKQYRMDLYLFGHYGDGSPHLNLLKREGTSLEDFQTEYTRLEKDLFPLFKRFGGSISAEHGVGILKRHWVTYSRSKEELRLFRAIKKAFDPLNLLNPGKILEE